MVLREMDIARVKQAWPWPGFLPVHKATGSHPASAASGGHHCAGVTLFEFYPVDDVPRITEGFGGWGLNLVEDKRGLLKIS